MKYANNVQGTRDVFHSVSSNLASLRRREKADMAYEEKNHDAQKNAGV